MRVKTAAKMTYLTGSMLSLLGSSFMVMLLHCIEEICFMDDQYLRSLVTKLDRFFNFAAIVWMAIRKFFIFFRPFSEQYPFFFAYGSIGGNALKDAKQCIDGFIKPGFDGVFEIIHYAAFLVLRVFRDCSFLRRSIFSSAI